MILKIDTFNLIKMKQTSNAIFISLLAILIQELSGYSQVLYNLKLEKGNLKSDKLILSDSTSIIMPQFIPANLYSDF